ncbi:excisionase family DNA-binding protein [Amycolatopsis sp. cmx-4-83]|uniref:excisionase family DNA-binding protein n=1 Tax=Amycolatopsis sp. cmx-4-83 TaxID=2790940 RepID=UPI003978EBB6
MTGVAAAIERLTERIGRLEKAVKAPPRKSWKPREVAAMTGLGYDTVLELIHAGTLRATKVGQLYVVADDEVDRFLGKKREAA